METLNEVLNEIAMNIKLDTYDLLVSEGMDSDTAWGYAINGNEIYSFEDDNELELVAF